jgi:hypothetical protein
MTRLQVIKKIDEARNAIRTFNRERIGKGTSAHDAAEIQEIQESSETLITELQAIGAPGQTCPRCHGSGRI